MLEQIPSLNLNDFTSQDSDKKANFVAKIGQAFTEYGFVSLKNHGLSDEAQNKLHEATKEFFHQEDQEKLKYEKTELFGQRGYVGKKKENAKDSKFSDLKEFYHIGNDIYAKNIWPTEPSTFKKITLDVYNQLERTACVVLKAIALYLNLEEDYFDDKVMGGNSILRLIHYYPLEGLEVKKGEVRAGAHGDINLITLLMGASAAGLEIQKIDGSWIPVTSLPGHIVINVGDMLERLTNNKLRSTIHRVVNPESGLVNTSRFSFPFFMHPKPNMKLNCLESCIDKENPKLHEDITAGNFLIQRLEEIGLKK